MASASSKRKRVVVATPDEEDSYVSFNFVDPQALATDNTMHADKMHLLLFGIQLS